MPTEINSSRARTLLRQTRTGTESSHFSVLVAQDNLQSSLGSFSMLDRWHALKIGMTVRWRDWCIGCSSGIIIELGRGRIIEIGGSSISDPSGLDHSHVQKNETQISHEYDTDLWAQVSNGNSRTNSVAPRLTCRFPALMPWKESVRQKCEPNALLRLSNQLTIHHTSEDCERATGDGCACHKILIKPRCCPRFPPL